MIRQAQVAPKDIEKIHDLLSQVLNVHHAARPDLFKSGARKYTDEELTEILEDPKRPIFVYENEDGEICGYAFCVLQQHLNNNILTDIKTLYMALLYFRWVLESKNGDCHLFRLMTIPLDKA